MDEHLERLGIGLIACWGGGTIILALIGFIGPAWPEPFYLPNWTLLALLIPLPLYYFIGWLSRL